MSLQPADRAAFLEMFADLGPEGEGKKAAAFLREHGDAALAELGARPGMDQVRAGVLRALPLLDVDAAPYQKAALEALDGFAEDVAQPDPAILLERAPAWAGLAYLEALGSKGWTPEATREAIALARVGFAAARLEGIGDGELLWALAEAAGEVGWTDRERLLLDEARGAAFADDERAAEVELLFALRCLQDGDPEGVLILEQVAQSESAATRTRVHARAVRGAIAQEQEELAVALTWFQSARAEVEADVEPEIAAQLDDVIRSLQSP